MSGRLAADGAMGRRNDWCRSVAAVSETLWVAPGYTELAILLAPVVPLLVQRVYCDLDE